jgi:hypothetical protein
MLTKSQNIVIAFGALLYLLSVTLILFHVYAIDLYLIFGFVGFLILLQLLGPAMARPKWRAKTDNVIMIGLFLFMALVLIKLINLMSS